MLRRARGYVPRPIAVATPFAEPVLACGAQLKNTFCFGRRDEAILGPHIGDLDSVKVYRDYEASIERLEQFLGITPEIVAHDLHPDYLSTRYALEQGRRDLHRRPAPSRARRQRDGRARARGSGDRRRLRRHRLRHRRRRVGRRAAARRLRRLPPPRDVPPAARCPAATRRSASPGASRSRSSTTRSRARRRSTASRSSAACRAATSTSSCA